MSGTKRNKSGASSETDNSRKKRKSQTPSSDTTPTSSSTIKTSKSKDENIPKKGATSIGEEVMYYPMEGNRQGLMIINRTFKDPKNIREGAEKDQKHLEIIYKHLDVDYEVANDLEEHEMYASIKKFSKNIKLPCSVIFVSISTHGKDDGGLMGTKWRLVSVGEIVNCFETKELLGIPKVFIIQACKGSTEEKRESLRKCGDDQHNQSTDPNQYCTKRADVLIAYSTSEGCVSYRNRYDGSWFIEVLKDCITNPKYEKRHFVEILTICTNNTIVKNYSDDDDELTQTPSYCSTLRKFLKFEKNPKKASKT